MKAGGKFALIGPHVAAIIPLYALWYNDAIGYCIIVECATLVST
jgi:hypothetical protein